MQDRSLVHPGQTNYVCAFMVSTHQRTESFPDGLAVHVGVVYIDTDTLAMRASKRA